MGFFADKMIQSNQKQNEKQEYSTKKNESHDQLKKEEEEKKNNNKPNIAEKKYRM